MKIVLACRAYPTQRPGGMLFVCQDRAHELVRLGHEVHVVTTSSPAHPGDTAFCEPVDRWVQDGPEWRKAPTGNCVHVHHLGNCPSTQYSREWAESAERLVARLQPDVVHLDGFDRAHPWWLSGPWTRAVTLHGFGWGGALTKWQLYLHGRGPMPDVNFEGLRDEARALEKYFHRVITISSHEYWLASDLYALGHVSLVYNPIPPEYFIRPLVPPPAQKLFLCASISGHHERCWDFVRSCASEAGVHVRQLQNIDRAQMPLMYDQATAVLVVSLYEQGFDLTVAEASARGRAVICQNIGSYGREADGDKFMMTITPMRRSELIELLLAPAENYPLIARIDGSPHEPANHVAEWFQALGM